MSYETCNELFPSTPCPLEYEGETLYNWTATTPYPATCTYNLREVAGVVMGMLSIVCWILVAIPQLWVNYVLKKADGLSIFFILQWFAADACNLAGAVVTKQVSSQIYLAIWYVIQDTMMFAQYLYYRRLNAGKDNGDGDGDDAGSVGRFVDALPGTPDETTKLVTTPTPIDRSALRAYLERHTGNLIGSEEEESIGTASDTASDAGRHTKPRGLQGRTPPASPTAAKAGPGVTLRAVLVVFGVSALVVGSGVTSPTAPAVDANPMGAADAVAHTTRATMRRVLQVDVNTPPQGGTPRNSTDAPAHAHASSSETNIYYLGIGLGWLSAVLYLGSRIPQLWKNWQRKSTDGLSPLMFTMAVGGNVTYFLSFFLITPTAEGMICHLPWVVGSLGTIFFDASALVQFLWYRKRSNELLEDAVGDEEKAHGQHSPIRLPGTSRASVARRRSTLTGIRAPCTTPATQCSGSEISVYPLALPSSVYAGSIRNSFYGRIGIWYNE